MSHSKVRYEGHWQAGTIYVAGMLEQLAAARVASIIGLLNPNVQTIRLDLRGVWYIDPNSFVRMARSLSTWHERSGGQITIAFPAQSEISFERRSSGTATLLHAATMPETERRSF